MSFFFVRLMPDSYPAVAILTALASSNVLPSLAALEQSVQSMMGHDECSSDRLNVPSDWSLSMVTWQNSSIIVHCKFKRLCWSKRFKNSLILLLEQSIKIFPVSRALMFQKIVAKLKFSPALFEKIPSFVCLVFKNENKWILKL